MRSVYSVVIEVLILILHFKNAEKENKIFTDSKYFTFADISEDSVVTGNDENRSKKHWFGLLN